MIGKPGQALLLALALATAACEKQPAQSAFEPDPIIHPVSGRVVFNRPCADEEPYGVQAYARMASVDGRAQAVVAYRAGYRATEDKAAYVELHLHRLKLNGGETWRNTTYAVRITGRAGPRVVEGPWVRQYMDAREWGPVDRPFRTNATGSADWITFIEPDDRRGDADRFHRIGPELALKARDLQVDSPQQEIDLALSLENEATGDTLELQGPRLRVPERVWAMTPPGFQELGLADTLNPYQEGGLFDALGRAWKYRQCIEERRAAKRSLGPYTGQGDGG